MSAMRIRSFWREKVDLQIQTILFNSDFDDICRTVQALDRSVSLAMGENALASAVLVIGDGSPDPVLTNQHLRRIRELSTVIDIRYDFFEANLGTAAGHNRMVANADEQIDFIWIQNPDVVVMPRLFEIVMASFNRPGIGQVEAKQLPIEHPKDYDPTTGETDWTTTACVMTPRVLFDELDGFDAESFFMYCDDVDFSFRIREAGYKTIFQPAAVCFHDKRLSTEGGWQPTNAERYFSAEAALIMAHKWSYPEIGAKTLAHFQSSGEPNLLKAAKVFEERRASGTLPAPRDGDHHIAHFHEIFYAKHRYSL